jgi:putative drug exporter of the RND superfamily
MERELAAGAALKREPWTVRIAVWSARHRWPVLAGWFLLIAGLMIGSLAVGGQRAQSTVDQGKTIGESQTGQDAFSNAGGTGDVSGEPFYLVVRATSGRLDTPANRAAVADITARLKGLTVSIAGEQSPVFYADPRSNQVAVVDPYALAAADPARAAGVLSADGTTAIVSASLAGDGDVRTTKAKATTSLLDKVEELYPSLTIHAFNASLLNAETNSYLGQSLDVLLLVSLVITFLILLVAARSGVAALVPIVLGLSALIGAMGVLGMYSQLVGGINPDMVMFVVLIGLAVGVDYSLFVTSRFRTERSSGRDKIGSIEVASWTAGRAVVFSGLAVIISLGSLLLINEDLLTSIAFGCTAVVLIAVLGSVTFLPATLSILDRWVMRFGIPFLARDRGEGRGIWAAVVRLATNRALVVASVATAVLVLMAAPVSGIRLGLTAGDPSTMPSSLEGVRAWSLIESEWPAGHNVTMDVIVTDATQPATAAAIANFEAAEKSGAVPGVNAATTSVSYSGNGTVARISAAIPGGANDDANWTLTRNFRASVVPRYFGSASGSSVYVAGDAAYAMDYATYFGAALPLVVVFVLGMSFLLLLIAFHSVVIPLKAILLNLLSSGATFGVLALLFQDGLFRDATGIAPNVVEAWAPLMIFAILFGLSMDYHVFILTRVKEARDRGLASGDAVVKGITSTAGTVTSAAAIMVCVFGSFVTVQIRVMQEFGVGLAVAILIDATIVRSLLLPALMKLLGEWNWWLPPFLRWMPRIAIEGEPEAVFGAGPAGLDI